MDGISKLTALHSGLFGRLEQERQQQPQEETRVIKAEHQHQHQHANRRSGSGFSIDNLLSKSSSSDDKKTSPPPPPPPAPAPMPHQLSRFLAHPGCQPGAGGHPLHAHPALAAAFHHHQQQQQQQQQQHPLLGLHQYQHPGSPPSKEDPLLGHVAGPVHAMSDPERHGDAQGHVQGLTCDSSLQEMQNSREEDANDSGKPAEFKWVFWRAPI